VGSPIIIHVYGTLNLNLPANSENEELETISNEIEQIGGNMSAKFDAIMRKVEEQGTVIDSVAVLIEQLQSDDLSDEETQQILTEMSNKTQVLADMVLRNTRAQSVEPATPTPAPGTVPGTTTGNNEGGGGTANAGAPTTSPEPVSPSEASTGGAPTTGMDAVGQPADTTQPQPDGGFQPGGNNP